MNIRVHPNPRFMKDLPRFEPVISDASSRSVFKKCNRRYFYEIVLGMKEQKVPPYLPFGSALHKCMEIWHKNPTLEAEARKNFAIKAAMDYHQKNISPQDIALGGKYDFYTLERLVLSCNMLIQFFITEQEQGQIEVLASEQVIMTALPDGNMVGGRADQMVKWKSRLVGRDLKTTSKDINYYDRTLEPNDQFAGYTYIQSAIHGEPVMGQFILVVKNSKGTKMRDYKDGGPEIKQFLTTRSAYQMAIWEAEQIKLAKDMQECRDNDFWPMNEQSCYNCPFRKTCSGGNEEAIKATLTSSFVRRPWDFTTVGDDD